MPSLGLVVGHAALSFTVTNLDAVCLLVMFFAKVKTEEGNTNANVCIAQMTGFSVIVGISLLGSVLGSSIDPAYISLLGIVPVLVSLRSMYNDWDWLSFRQYMYKCIIRESIGKDGGDRPQPNTDEGGQDESRKADCEFSLGTPATSFMSTVDVDVELSPVSQREDNESGENEICETDSEQSLGSGSQAKRQVIEWLKCWIPGQIVENTIITISNGGDNIAIYVALFSVSEMQAVVITLAVYYILLACWLLAAYIVIGNGKITKTLTDNGRYIVPVCLIATGFYILSDSVLFHV